MIFQGRQVSTKFFVLDLGDLITNEHSTYEKTFRLYFVRLKSRVAPSNAQIIDATR